MPIMKYAGYHAYIDAVSITTAVQTRPEARFAYTFDNFFHPFVGELVEKLNKGSLADIFDPVYQKNLSEIFFPTSYPPVSATNALVNHFPKEIDVHQHGPYANYNWELFFHIPLTVAVHLSKSQRFAEAQRWFHFIFDPTSTDQSELPPKRFWRFLAFRDPDNAKSIDEIVRLLSTPTAQLSPADQQQQADVLEGYKAILNSPFQPHKVARTRPIAYQYSVVMKYLDNLIAWGDYLFQQDTVESINEATQRYVLAANLLGERPQRIPAMGLVQPKTFAQLKKQGLGPIGNALVELEGQFPFNLISTSTGESNEDTAAPLFGIGRTLYFCIPRNEKLLSYWDTVADRLFKIRHCMNIAGVVRPLALFDPPLDPGMLVKAAAAGIDISSIVNGLNQPVGPVRCLTLIQKTIELCSEVRGLGGALLSALEKGDSERLALVRQSHEIKIQQMSQDVKYLQWQSAREATKSLLTTRQSALERLRFYQRQLGLPQDQNAPDTLALDRRELTEENFDEAYAALVGQYDKALTLQRLPPLTIQGATSPSQQSGAAGQGRLFLNTNESVDLNQHGPTARDFRVAATVSDGIHGVLGLIPDMGLDLKFWGLGGNAKLFGGSLFAGVGRIISGSLNTKAADEDSKGGSAAKSAGYERRGDDWMLQYNLAARELMQIGRQILTSLLAEQISYHEYLNLKKQIANSREVDQFLHDKFTNDQLYLWMQGEISRLYYEYYRFAFDTARKAERTMKHELMRPEVDDQTFVKFNYWDGGRKGLLSGEALHLDVKRMEMAYHDNNKRELELTRHVSLRQLNPLALLTLKTTGTCQVTIPEWLYDRDCPGHYMRRIKSVGVSLPSVVGPYTSVNCTLSLLRSTVRKSPLLKDNEYARQGSEDDRFVNYTGSIQSIVTSAGNNDSGLFETSLRDERFLPFEYAGAESTWKLDLPNNYRAFDYASISDVILHVRYTARQGVDQAKVRDSLDTLFQSANDANLALLFSLRHDFPTEWSAFINSAVGPFTVTIRRDYFPYFTQDRTVQINALELYTQDVTKHHAIGNTTTATNDLNDPTKKEFVLTAPADPAGPNQVLKRAGGAAVFLIMRYSL
jgi:hypothetical protein